MNKITTVRIDENILQKIKVYAEVNNISQTDLINKLLTDGLDQMILERSGAGMFTIPNPQELSITGDDFNNVRDFLATTAMRFHDMHCNIHVPFYGILGFLEQRLIYDSPEEIEKFKANKTLDHSKEIRKEK